jgi:hypothetical protein
MSRNWRRILGWKQNKVFEPGARVRTRNLTPIYMSERTENLRDGEEGVIVCPYGSGEMHSWDIKFDSGKMFNGSLTLFIAIPEQFLELI